MLLNYFPWLVTIIAQTKVLYIICFAKINSDSLFAVGMGIVWAQSQEEAVCTGREVPNNCVLLGI